MNISQNFGAKVRKRRYELVWFAIGGFPVIASYGGIMPPVIAFFLGLIIVGSIALGTDLFPPEPSDQERRGGRSFDNSSGWGYIGMAVTAIACYFHFHR